MDALSTRQPSRRLPPFLKGLNHLLWPAVCAYCGNDAAEEDRGLCGRCWRQLLVCTAGRYCRRCGREAGGYAVLDGRCPRCQGEDIYLDGIARAGVYTQVLRDMIVAFKLSGRTELISILGFLAGSALDGSCFSGEIELFVPVPLHWTRRLARGYNQSQLVARKLRRPSAKVARALVRIRRTCSQTTLPGPAGRRANVAGAFTVRRKHDIRSRVVCLVDDVKTTGATLNECARTLKQAGAANVFAVVLAVAGQFTA